MPFGLLVAGFILLVTAFHSKQLVHTFHEHRKITAAKADIRALSRYTMQAFLGQRPPQADRFWQEMGRSEPVLDPWGRPYQIQSNTSYWTVASFGADGTLGTADDLRVALPLEIDGRLPTFNSEVPVDAGPVSQSAF